MSDESRPDGTELEQDGTNVRANEENSRAETAVGTPSKGTNGTNGANGVTRIVLTGPDETDLSGAFASLGIETRRIQGIVTRDSLLDAGIGNAEILVLTDTGDASVIPVAKDENPQLRIVVYTHDSLPEFARGQADLAIDPDLLGPDVVAEELG